jgi:hypothetical protein
VLDSAVSSSLVTEAPQSDLTIVKMVGGGPTSQRPGNPPSFFKYFDTDLQKSIVWNGVTWIIPITGAQGAKGVTGGQGPVGPQGTPAGSISWDEIRNKPVTFDIKAWLFNDGNDGGFIQWNNGYQMTWFSDVARTTEAIFNRTIPRTVNHVLMVYVSTSVTGTGHLNPDDTLFQVLSWNSSNVQYAAQNLNQTSFNPVIPRFLVISWNPGTVTPPT